MIKYGADLIKICASGGVLSRGDQPGTEQYTLEEMQAIVEEAHRLGRKVAAHAHGTEAISDLRAGVDSVEHASLIDDEGIALAKKRGAFLVSTFTMTITFCRMGPRMECWPNPSKRNGRSGSASARIFARQPWRAHA